MKGSSSMRLGISSYCLCPNLRDGKMTIFDVIRWAADHDCQHIEFVPFYLDFLANPELIDRVREACAEANLPISTYSLNADLLKPDLEERRAEIQRVKTHIDVAHRLGLTKMRHDVASFRRPMSSNTPQNFMKEFPLMVEGVREVADYAASYGMTTTLENHGFFVNGSDRVISLLEAVDRKNVRMTIDVGNFLCVDERGENAVKKCLPYADMIHLKDFYIRDKARLAGVGGLFDCDNGSWFETVGGSMLRGAILGQGDLNIWKILGDVKHAGYDGDISIEFEGMEPCEAATETCLRTARTIWEQV